MQVRFDLFSFEFEGRLINFKKGADSFSIVFFLSKLLYLYRNDTATRKEII